MPHDQIPSALRATVPTVWPNPHLLPGEAATTGLELTRAELDEAIADWAEFAPAIAALFPETAATGGQITSPLRVLATGRSAEIVGQAGQPVLVKCDNELPVAGSIKARGGIFELLRYARGVAADHGLMLRDPAARQIFARHRVLVGSTGNLGYSIGVVGLALGFQVEIHMSSDARQW